MNGVDHIPNHNTLRSEACVPLSSNSEKNDGLQQIKDDCALQWWLLLNAKPHQF